MICNPAPEQNCGFVQPDTCVAVTLNNPTNNPATPVSWGCFMPSGYLQTCWRQSEFNYYAGNQICVNTAAIAAIDTQLGFTGNLGLTGCTGFTPVNTTVSAEFQALYNQLCTFQYNLNQPINVDPSKGGLHLGCLSTVCGTPIGTLGQLLQALINCCCNDSPSGQTSGY